MTTKSLANDVKSGEIRNPVGQKSPLFAKEQDSGAAKIVNGSNDYNSSFVKVSKLVSPRRDASGSEIKQSALFNPDSGYFKASSSVSRSNRPLATENLDPRSADILKVAAELARN